MQTVGRGAAPDRTRPGLSTRSTDGREAWPRLLLNGVFHIVSSDQGKRLLGKRDRARNVPFLGRLFWSAETDSCRTMVVVEQTAKPAATATDQIVAESLMRPLVISYQEYCEFARERLLGAC